MEFREQQQNSAVPDLSETACLCGASGFELYHGHLISSERCAMADENWNLEEARKLSAAE